MSTAQWANIGEDAGALHALLGRIPEHAAVAAIDYLWIFPPRKIAIGESVVVVIAAFDEDPARRRVSTAHFTISRNKKGVATVSERFAEHGSAPEPAVPRIVEGVLRRLGEDTEAAPREEKIDGETERWVDLIVDLGGTAPEGIEPTGADDNEQAAGSPADAETAPAEQTSASAPQTDVDPVGAPDPAAERVDAAAEPAQVDDAGSDEPQR